MVPKVARKVAKVGERASHKEVGEMAKEVGVFAKEEAVAEVEAKLF